MSRYHCGDWLGLTSNPKDEVLTCKIQLNKFVRDCFNHNGKSCTKECCRGTQDLLIHSQALGVLTTRLSCHPPPLNFRKESKYKSNSMVELPMYNILTIITGQWPSYDYTTAITLRRTEGRRMDKWLSCFWIITSEKNLRQTPLVVPSFVSDG